MNEELPGGIIINQFAEYADGLKASVDLLKHRAETAERERDEIKRIIADPAAVWTNILRGTIARPAALDHYEGCKTELKIVKRERDEARKQAAAMREALESWMQLFDMTDDGKPNHTRECDLTKSALSSDAGKDYVKRSELEASQKRVHVVSTPINVNNWYCARCGEQTTGDAELCFECSGKYVPLADVEPLLYALRVASNGSIGHERHTAKTTLKAWDAKHPAKK